MWFIIMNLDRYGIHDWDCLAEGDRLFLVLFYLRCVFLCLKTCEWDSLHQWRDDNTRRSHTIPHHPTPLTPPRRRVCLVFCQRRCPSLRILHLDLSDVLIYAVSFYGHQLQKQTLSNISTPVWLLFHPPPSSQSDQLKNTSSATAFSVQQILIQHYKITQSTIFHYRRIRLIPRRNSGSMMIRVLYLSWNSGLRSRIFSREWIVAGKNDRGHQSSSRDEG